MELRWDYLFGIIVVIVVGIALALDKATADDLIAAVSLIIALVTGTFAVNVLRTQNERLFDERFGKKTAESHK